MDEVFCRFLQVLNQTQWLPRQDLIRYQHALLDRLVRHAYENVPLCRERLACLFTRDGSVDFSRWDEVPVVTRAEAAARNAEMRAPQLPDIYGPVQELYTSGSTTTPLAIASNMLVSIAARAAFARLVQWSGADPSRPLARIRVHGSDAPSYPKGRDGRGWTYLDLNAGKHDLDLFTPVDQQLEWLLRKRAPYLLTSASNAMALAYAASRDQARELAIEIIFAVAETVLPQARQVVAERLGARIVAIYSCEEIGLVATQCPVRECYHVAAENAVVEILRPDGTSASPGEIGQVVLTGLYNYAMPFIRYAIGDVATAGPEVCGCGRSLPVIAQVEGRTRHAFVFRDGSRTWPRLLNFRVEDYVACREFQVVQIDRETIEFRYVPNGHDCVRDRAGLDAYLRSKLHPSIVVNLVAMEAIPRGPAGKFDPFISLTIV